MTRIVTCLTVLRERHESRVLWDEFEKFNETQMFAMAEEQDALYNRSATAGGYYTKGMAGNAGADHQRHVASGRDDDDVRTCTQAIYLSCNRMALTLE